MSHQFDCLVDTTEMAREIDSVKKHVNATTTAVVGMQAAVIKAQADGADHVCKKVNQGFYALIHSQISQKMASLQSKVDAHLLRLNQQRKQLAAIRQRMERDYQMLSGRYLKIFNSLNRNLRHRITEIDRPILNFATTEADKVTNRGNQLISTVPIGQSETIRTSQAVASSNLKYRASRAIESIESFIADSNRLKAITDRILLHRSISDDIDTVFVPVCIAQSNIDANGNIQTTINISEIGLSKDARQTIETRIATSCREDSMAWKKPEEIDPEIANYFSQMVASSGLPQRQRDTMLEMFGKNIFETL
ncbi:MAG: hypothetical protein K2K75_13645 [Muribaculaceae bacterium]|nr:hypothetical protein [Muribaculaceae bacterium]